MKLRPYQQEAKQAVKDAWRSGKKKTLVVLPTGCGKTVVFAKLAEEQSTAGEHVLVLAHRAELLKQAADKLKQVADIECGVEKGSESNLGSEKKITVGSIQTFMREQRLSKFPNDYFGTIIVDEAHHCLSDGYQRVLTHFGAAKVLGVTATPDRGDMRDLGSYFESLAYEYSLASAIRDGYLTPIKAMTIPLKLDLTKCDIQAGDFKASDLSNVLEPFLTPIAKEMQRVCRNRKTVVFLPLVRVSQEFRDILNDHGFRAAEVNGASEDREEVLRDFEDGKYNVLCNSMLLTEGWDCPSVNCVIVLRPTKIRGLYSQMVGRGTRLCEGKTDLLLLDFLWNTERHELCHPAHLICDNKELADTMTKNIDNSGTAIDIIDAEKQASREMMAAREYTLAATLREMRERQRTLVDPIQFEMSIQAGDLSGYTPVFAWEMKAVTEKQRAALKKFGIYPDDIENSGKASQIISRLAKRREEGLTTPKQIRCLEKLGFMYVGTWKYEDAYVLIDAIASNEWKVPRGIEPSMYVPRR